MSCFAFPPEPPISPVECRSFLLFLLNSRQKRPCTQLKQKGVFKYSPTPELPIPSLPFQREIGSESQGRPSPRQNRKVNRSKKCELQRKYILDPNWPSLCEGKSGFWKSFYLCHLPSCQSHHQSQGRETEPNISPLLAPLLDTKGLAHGFEDTEMWTCLCSSLGANLTSTVLSPEPQYTEVRALIWERLQEVSVIGVPSARCHHIQRCWMCLRGSSSLFLARGCLGF